MRHGLVVLSTACLACVVSPCVCGGALALEPGAVTDTGAWIRAGDTTRVVQSGQWTSTSFRYADAEHVWSDEDGAALAVSFRGTGVVLRLPGPIVAGYGTPAAGRIDITVDGGEQHSVFPQASAREIVLARGLPNREHSVRLVHHFMDGASECRIEGFRVLDAPTGDLSFVANGEENAFLVDVRAVLARDGHTVRNALVRNWLTGQCRLAGLPPGDEYALELRASGWQTRRIDRIAVRDGQETVLPPIYLLRDESARVSAFQCHYPAIGRPAVRRPGEAFRARLASYNAPIERVRLTRRVGPATVSRSLAFEEDATRAFYYDREVVATLPDDMPPGLYDLAVSFSRARGTRALTSARSVQVVPEYPADPMFMTFGHLDTWGQNQAEYLERMADVANLLGPEMVLVANEVNPAYVSGALMLLEMPYVVTFGNHQFPGHEQWYGEPVGVVDLGPDICILNFGLRWHADISKADALLSARPNARIKIINSFEHNAPVEAFLDRHRVSLIHDGHGPGRKVMQIGSTPTVRVGKVDSESFRVVRFRDGRVVSAAYRGDDVAPVPFPRNAEPPLRLAYSPANDGTRPEVTAAATNDLEEAFPNCRATFVMPPGEYETDRGRIESVVESDDCRYRVIVVRFDLPARDTVAITIRPKAARNTPTGSRGPR